MYISAAEPMCPSWPLTIFTTSGMRTARCKSVVMDRSVSCVAQTEGWDERVDLGREKKTFKG